MNNIHDDYAELTAGEAARLGTWYARYTYTGISGA